jgi:hypothetical protein
MALGPRATKSIGRLRLVGRLLLEELVYEPAARDGQTASVLSLGVVALQAIRRFARSPQDEDPLAGRG